MLREKVGVLEAKLRELENGSYTSQGMSPSLSLSESSGGHSSIDPVEPNVNLSAEMHNTLYVVHKKNHYNSVTEPASKYPNLYQTSSAMLFLHKHQSIRLFIIRYSLPTQPTQPFPHERNLSPWIFFLKYTLFPRPANPTAATDLTQPNAVSAQSRTIDRCCTGLLSHCSILLFQPSSNGGQSTFTHR